MNRNDFSPEDNGRLLKAIAGIIMERGLKATTMDLVASRLSMSKRTLYEIFDSKTAMAAEAIAYVHRQHIKTMQEAFGQAPTVVEGWLSVIRFHRDMIRSTNVNFFRDMDSLYQEVKGSYRNLEVDREREFVRLCRLGVDQGVFRPDVNYAIQARIFEIQLESLKRMEDLFPPDISVAEVYDTICIGFLRSIVTPRGMRIIDSMTIAPQSADTPDTACPAPSS